MSWIFLQFGNDIVIYRVCLILITFVIDLCFSVKKEVPLKTNQTLLFKIEILSILFDEKKGIIEVHILHVCSCRYHCILYLIHY